MPKFNLYSSPLICLGNFKATFRMIVLSGVAATFPAIPGQGQSFLEKLEAAVKQQVNSSSATPEASPVPAVRPSENSEELPPPSSGSAVERTNGNPIPNPFGAIAPSSSQPSAGQLPSILEGKTDNLSASTSGESLPLTPGQTPTAQPIPAEGRVYLGLEVEELLGGGIGVRVASVSENSPAWKAGFRLGDRIQGIDGHAIKDNDSMADRLRRTVAGNPVKFLINRAGRNLELVAVLLDAELAGRIQSGAGTSLVYGPPWMGISVHDVTPAFRNQFGLSIFSGAAVTNVVAGSPAYQAGLRPGDAIVEINGAPITQGDDLMSWIARAQVGEPVELISYRGTQRSVLSTVLASDPQKVAVMERQKPATPNARIGISTAPNSLQIEVDELRVQLAETQEQLLQTQRQLEQLMQQLNK